MSMTVEKKEFREALSSFGTGITIITTCDENGNAIGMTASSFNSVSMDPPLILWSVVKTAFSAEIFKTAENFSVHILSTENTELSNKFATSGANKLRLFRILCQLNYMSNTSSNLPPKYICNWDNVKF
ncbi:MAG: flavin reductase family protein, partial [Alphaproteobacteria bacterium]|nr:flavin reductase family protein [Alphaproteobacteria bacterium]